MKKASDSPDTQTLENKVVIITGATRGIGKCLALSVSKRGAAVIVTGKSTESTENLPGSIYTVTEEIQKAGGTALPIQLDVRDEHAIEDMVSKTVNAFGRIDVLINNAGALWWQPVMQTPLKRLDLMIGVNVRAAFACSRAVIPHMQAIGGGHIINYSPPIRLDVLSKPAQSPSENRNVGYLISKFGMSMLTLGLAEEMRHHQIAVNSLWPITAIESQATLHWNVMTPRDWRKPEIVADATLALIKKSPALAIEQGLTGHTWTDEELLRREGITDFSPYRCDPNHEPRELMLE